MRSSTTGNFSPQTVLASTLGGLLGLGIGGLLGIPTSYFFQADWIRHVQDVSSYTNDFFQAVLPHIIESFPRLNDYASQTTGGLTMLQTALTSIALTGILGGSLGAFLAYWLTSIPAEGSLPPLQENETSVREEIDGADTMDAGASKEKASTLIQETRCQKCFAVSDKGNVFCQQCGARLDAK